MVRTGSDFVFMASSLNSKISATMTWYRTMSVKYMLKAAMMLSTNRKKERQRVKVASHGDFMC